MQKVRTALCTKFVTINFHLIIVTPSSCNPEGNTMPVSSAESESFITPVAMAIVVVVIAIADIMLTAGCVKHSKSNQRNKVHHS